MRDHPRIDTGRLILEPVAAEHAVGLHRVYSDARAMRFWPTPPHPSERETLDMITALIAGPDRA